MPYHPTHEEWRVILEERQRDLEEWNRWTFENRQQNSNTTEESCQSSNGIPTTKQKLMESTENRKELQEMSKYHIGTLLPEARSSYLKIYGVSAILETSTRIDESKPKRQESSDAYHVGSLLSEAKPAYAKLYLRESA